MNKNENRQLQIDELEALESSFREEKIQKLSDWNDETVLIKGSIELSFETNRNDPVNIEGTKSNGENFEIKVNVLPSIFLQFELDSNYPSDSSPSLNVVSNWMTIEQKIECQNKIHEICEEYLSMQVLYVCYEEIKNIVQKWEISTIFLNNSYILKENKSEKVENLLQKLMENCEKIEQENFENSLFDCEVCFNSLNGKDCIKFDPCQHVFCKKCIQDYYTSIAKGVISKQMQCPGDSCSSEANEIVIKEALGEELYEKYGQAMLEKAIQSMDDVIQCPREKCQKVAYRTNDPKLVTCSYCLFSFCISCKQTFHGVENCKFSEEDKKQILEKWENGDNEIKEQMCLQYGGEKALKSLIELFQNDVWFKENSKPCPRCYVSIEKNEGCHKMHCAHCDTFFCWLCSEILSKVDPYQHFQGDGKCSGRLFEGVDHYYLNEDNYVDELQNYNDDFDDDDDNDDENFDPDVAFDNEDEDEFDPEEEEDETEEEGDDEETNPGEAQNVEVINNDV